MNDELTRWADSARDHKAKLDWATTALCDILELASGKKSDPDSATLEELVASAIEAVRALKAELEQAKQEGKSLQTQVDRKCEELLRLHDELTRLRDIVSEADVALIDAVLEETK